MNEFNAKKTTEALINWIKDWFNKNGKDCNAIIGISGGKDSNIVAALCVRALGKDRVIGISMPNTLQSSNIEQYEDDKHIKMLVDLLGIKHFEANITPVYSQFTLGMNKATKWDLEITEQTRINLSPRIRMSMLYAFSQSLNGRVVNTDNLSENHIGYFTKWGNVGDVSPLANLTVTEIKAIGRELGLPNALIDKVPNDGLSGKTDEENFGFSYEVLDKYIRTGVCDDAEIKEKIDNRHNNNLFKLQPVESFKNVFFN